MKLCSSPPTTSWQLQFPLVTRQPPQWQGPYVQSSWCTCVPACIHSDRGTSFESATIQELCRLYGIAKSRTTPYHPAGNGLCERFNRTLLNLIGTMGVEKKQRWAEYLPELCFHYNNSFHASTGYTPHYLMFGRHSQLPVDLMVRLPEQQGGESPDDWVAKHHYRLKRVCEGEVPFADETTVPPVHYGTSRCNSRCMSTVLNNFLG